MKANDILEAFWNGEEFDGYIIQMFVENDGKFNYTFFNKFHETSFTHAQINTAIEEISGSKVIRFREEPIDDTALDALIKDYKFGKHENVRVWIHDILDRYGVIIPRSVLFNWVAKQHPPKQQGSFLPTDDRNMYVKEEKEAA